MNLETKRLILRKLRASDLDDFHSFRSNPDICKFQSFTPFTIEESKKFIAEQSKTEFGIPGEWVQAGIVWKENDKLVGDFALKPERDEPRTVEIGVSLNTEYHGKGFAVEAFNKVFEYLFTKTDTHRIIGLLDTKNHGSRKLMKT